MLNDPETLATLEENAGLKFIPVAEYEAMRDEINEAEERLAKIKQTIKEREKEGEAKRAELGPLKAEYEKMLANTNNLGLDKWCGDCKWNGKTSCDARNQYVSKVDIMKQSPNCIKK
jgi:hypothetical protein